MAENCNRGFKETRAKDKDRLKWRERGKNMITNKH